MAVDFRDLRFKLEQMDVWSVRDEKGRMNALMDSLDSESIRALALMATKRHTVRVAPDDTKTFELLENIISGLLSEDCVPLAKQAIAIAPEWMVKTVLITSVNRFNTVDQNAMREVISARQAELQAEFGSDAPVELSAEDIAAAHAAAVAAAEARKEELNAADAAAVKKDKPKFGLFGKPKTN